MKFTQTAFVIAALVANTQAQEDKDAKPEAFDELSTTGLDETKPTGEDPTTTTIDPKDFDGEKLPEDFDPKDFDKEKMENEAMDMLKDEAKEMGVEFQEGVDGYENTIKIGKDVEISISDDKETKMRVAFRDFFYWALVGETTDPEVASTCTSACGEITDMCCATVLMKKDTTNFYEKHCINQGVVKANFMASIGDFDISMKCDQMSSGAAKMAASLSVAALAAFTLY